MAGMSDLKIAAKLRPELFKRICATERRIGHTISMPKKGQSPVYLDNRIRLASESDELSGIRKGNTKSEQWNCSGFSSKG